MTGPVNLIPPGILNLVDLRTLGAAPKELVESYQPTIETFDWFVAGFADFAAFEITIPTGTYSAWSLISVFHTVPAREWWYVYDWTITARGFNATDNVTYYESLAVPNVNQSVGGTAAFFRKSALMTHTGSAGPPGGEVQTMVGLDRGFWAPPNANFCFGASLAVIGASSMLACSHLRFRRLKA